MASSAFYHTGRVLDAYRRRGLSYPYEYDRLLDADLIIIAGANLLSNNHVFGDRVRDAYKLRGSRIMVIDPSPTALAAIADAHVKPLPGSDAAFFDALGSSAASGADAACKACGIGADDFCPRIAPCEPCGQYRGHLRLRDIRIRREPAGPPQFLRPPGDR